MTLYMFCYFYAVYNLIKFAYYLELWRPPQNVQGLLEQVGIALNQGFKKIQTEMSLVVKGEDKSIVQMYEEMADVSYYKTAT